MKRQLSYKNKRPSLFLVATPIGNLDEFTFRAVEILKEVDIIACEDTRTSLVLLKKYNIETKLISYHNFNEKESSLGIINLLKKGLNIALISDAGYPLISDPGYELVNQCVLNDFNVVPISGASASLNALVASCLNTNHFYFYGFLNHNKNEAFKELNSLKYFVDTMIFYESPHRISRTLSLLYEVFGNRKICIAKEISKQYEEFIRGELKDFQKIENLKGELVIVCEGYKKEEVIIDYNDMLKEVEDFINSGLSAKDAIAEVARKYQVSKKEIYNRYHQA